MSRNVPINVIVDNDRQHCINTEIPDQYPLEIQTGDPHGLVPRDGLPGQVLTKTNRSYKWSDNPISVDTFIHLPENPSTHCLYFIKDTLKLVY